MKTSERERLARGWFSYLFLCFAYATPIFTFNVWERPPTNGRDSNSLSAQLLVVCVFPVNVGRFLDLGLFFPNALIQRMSKRSARALGRDQSRNQGTNIYNQHQPTTDRQGKEIRSVVGPSCGSVVLMMVCLFLSLGCVDRERVNVCLTDRHIQER